MVLILPEQHRALRNTVFIACKLNHAVKSLSRRGFLFRRTEAILQQVMSERRWATLWY